MGERSVGQPGFKESLIPVWGSARAAVDDFQNGRWGWGIFNSVMAVSDVLLVKTLFTAAGKVAVKAGVQAVEGIYEFTAASGKTYVGQSGNIAARLEQHIASGKLLPGTPVSITEVLGGKTAREIAEQLRINYFGGIYQDGIKVLENMRNPIGSARQYLLP